VKKIKRCILITILAFLFLYGCTHLGPRTVPRDRFDYNTAISDSWKEQTLLNIVKIRYADMPLFVEVASVVSGYTLEGSVDLSGTLSSDDAVQGDFLSMGTGGKYTDRPTITYTPITGQQFNLSFMLPIPPSAVLFLMQTGWPVDLIMPLTVEAINGLRAQVSAGANQRAGDPRFYRVIDLLRKIQKSGAVGMQIIRETEFKETTLMFFNRENISPESEAATKEIDQLLGLRPGAREITVSYGLLPKSDTEIAMLTRSMLHIMIELASKVDVPTQHVTEGRTVPSLVQEGQTVAGFKRLIKINHGPNRPDNAFTAVRYRDYWYWIDDRDFHSKRTFTFVMILMSLSEKGGTEDLPVVTIPAG
jgi:hypothetical protein